MKMKWLVPVLLLVQANYLSSCIFDKVEEVSGRIERTFNSDLNGEDCPSRTTFFHSAKCGVPVANVS
ncbi:unnamed protein product [Cylicocyclus nassatus]|uniref:Uncharacterized protein n=1 Tax=Cylicocyclus nassatus TaxID=53992 RepID=A0AA36GL02_CYLNA|nr:unnamed protein product [Cylicocyclus nassatus]